MTLRDQIPALDGLRALAILSVLRFHVAVPTWIPQFPFSGPQGVDIFFALSGFLITRILIADRHAGRGALRFYVRRSSRILPAFLLFCAVLTTLWPNREMLTVWTYTYNLFFDWRTEAPVGHMWSLCVEEHFYLLWPVVVLCLPMGASKRIAALGIVGSFLAMLFAERLLAETLLQDRITAVLYSLTPFRVTAICGGAMIAYYERELRSRPRLLMAMAVGLILWGWSFGTTMRWWHVFPDHGIYTAELTGQAMIGVGMLCAGLSTSWHTLQVVLCDRFMAYAGRISYGLYLYHFPIYYYLGIAGGATWGNVWTALAAIATTFAVAHLSYHYFEIPVRDAINRRFDAWQARRTSPLPELAPVGVAEQG